jgi:hypothetical protein
MSLTKITGSGAGAEYQRYESAIRIRTKMLRIHNTIYCLKLLKM